MIQIWTFPADPSTERVPSLAERVAYLRHPINLRLFNWRVPALLAKHGGAYFSAVYGSIEDPVAAPGPCKPQVC